MARPLVLATSLAVHAAAFTLVVLLPVFRPELPPARPGPLPMPDLWPIPQRVVLADSRPPRATPRSTLARAGPSLDAVPSRSVPMAEPEGLPEPDAAGLDPDAPFSIGPVGTACCVGTEGPDGGAGASGPPGEPGGTGSEPLRIVGGIRPPTKLHHVQPEYSELARRAGISGTVVLECLIDATGTIADVRVLSGSPLLVPAAVNAVRQWRYSPTLLRAAPVPVLLTVTVRFDLKR